MGAKKQAPKSEGVERIKVRVRPNGGVDSNTAAVILGRKPRTLAQWRWQRVGPPWKRVRGRIEYDYDVLVNYED
jgi:hypothetical protein